MLKNETFGSDLAGNPNISVTFTPNVKKKRNITKGAKKECNAPRIPRVSHTKKSDLSTDEKDTKKRKYPKSTLSEPRAPPAKWAVYSPPGNVEIDERALAQNLQTHRCWIDSDKYVKRMDGLGIYLAYDYRQYNGWVPVTHAYFHALFMKELPVEFHLGTYWKICEENHYTSHMILGGARISIDVSLSEQENLWVRKEFCIHCMKYRGKQNLGTRPATPITFVSTCSACASNTCYSKFALDKKKRYPKAIAPPVVSRITLSPSALPPSAVPPPAIPPSAVPRITLLGVDKFERPSIVTKRNVEDNNGDSNDGILHVVFTKTDKK